MAEGTRAARGAAARRVCPECPPAPGATRAARREATRTQSPRLRARTIAREAAREWRSQAARGPTTAPRRPPRRAGGARSRRSRIRRVPAPDAPGHASEPDPLSHPRLDSLHLVAKARVVHLHLPE